MFSPFERMISGRYLRARRREGFISVIAAFSFLGIMLGVATLIIVMSVMNGFRHELLGRILGINGHMSVYSYQGGLTDYDAMADRLRGLEGIVALTPIVEGQALLTSGASASGVVVRGIRRSDFASRPVLSDSIVKGSLENYGEDRVAVGIRMAERLNIRLGDFVMLVAPEGKASPFGTIPRTRRYPVAAVFDVGMYEYNNNFIFMPLEASQAFFRTGDAVTTLEIVTQDPDRLDAMRAVVERELGGSAKVVDWRDTNNSFFNAVQVERNVMFLILTLIIVVAAFNIISSLIMLVKDKGRDIAVLRTMGATKGMVMRIFFLTGASIGTVGTIFGTLLGTAFALNIESIRQLLQRLTGTDLFSAEVYFLSQLPARLEWSDVVTIVLMALALSFAATIYPAWRAARLDPVEALRYE